MLRNNKNLTWSNNSVWISKTIVDERGGCSNQSKIFREVNASKLQGQHAALSVLIYVDMKVTGSHPEVLLENGVLKICSKFTGEHPCRSAISIKLLCKFTEIALWHECSPVNLLHIFRTSFAKNTSGRLLLEGLCPATKTEILHEYFTQNFVKF